MFSLFRHGWVGKKAPEISGQNWFNETALPLAVREKIKRGEPIDISSDLAGYVVLVDFWDYSCINCINTMPYLKEWWHRYRHLKFLILGVHTPEFEFGKDPEKVESAILRFELNYPVVSDPDYTTWRRYNNTVWPRELIIDGQGVVRYDHRGEGDYAQKETVIQELLSKSHPQEKFAKPLLPIKETDVPGAVCYPITPEIYAGYRRGEAANPGGLVHDSEHLYVLPQNLPSHHWALAGTWQATLEDVISGEGDVSPSFHLTYEATEVFAVMRSITGAPLFVEIRQDGEPVTADIAGEDVVMRDSKSLIAVEDDRLYRLVTNASHGQHTIELVVPKGLVIHTFTFGSSCVS